MGLLPSFRADVCDVVLGMKPVNKEDVDPFEAIIEEVKHAKA